MNATAELAEAGKYLTFALGQEEYGVGILQVREIIGVMPVSPIPGAPPYVLGVINLRGHVIPVVDLRRRFGLDPIPPTEVACIIVVEARRTEIGLLVDRVSEVAEIGVDAIAPSPNWGATVDTRYVRGIARTSTGIRILLDIDRTLEDFDIAGAASAAGADPEGER